MVTVELHQEFQDADASRARATRLPPRRERGLPVVHRAAEDEGPVEDALFPRRGPLGDEAAEFATLVQDGQRLGRPVDEEVERRVCRPSGTCMYAAPGPSTEV